ncbi:MAG: TonB-dependent receptor [Sphingobacteriia bacterium]|nr:TonB-dependent receptor [Sphingobacteriia bacterium]
MSKTFAIIAALLSAQGLLAQKDTTKTRVLDPVIVTANKIEQKQSTTGKVITVINKDQIEKSSFKTVAQLLNEQAGITINGALNNLGSVQSLYIRGTNSGRALILLDGIPVSDPSMINNEGDLNLFSLNGMERIEVCRGAESTLYGSDAIGGVINIITVKKDVTKPINAKATLSTGNYGTFRGNVQVYGKEKNLSYTARYARLASKGFSAAYDSTGTKNFDNDEYIGDVANVQANYQLTKTLSVKAFSLYSKYKAGLDAGPFADKQNDDVYNQMFLNGTGFQFKKEGITVNGTYRYSKQNRKYDDNYSVPGAAAYSLNEYNSIGQYAELYASIKLNKTLTLLSGVDYRYGSFNNTYKSLSSFGPYNSTFNDTSSQQTSLYASLIYNANRFNIEVGGRANNHSQYGANYTYTINPSYNINSYWQVFASVATGFKIPSLYQLYDRFSGNSNLNPETAVNFQTGVQFKNTHVTTRVVYFNRNVNNGIDYNYISSRYYNYIKQQVNGLEAEIMVKPVERLSITANYTFLSGNETTQNRITNKDTVTYNYLLRRPKHNVNLTIDWQATKALYVSATGKYVSSRYDIGGYKKADVPLDGYCIVSAYAEYAVNSVLKFFADGQNITNKKFFDIRGYNSIPFLFNIGVTVKL